MSAPHTPEQLKTTLQFGKMDVQGQFLLGSNYTFFVQVRHKDFHMMAVYKPMRGERPLYDFPENSLAKREVAAWLVSQALGWDLVPLTVLREDAPFGSGSLQQFIDYDPEYHYFTFTESDKKRLPVVALFDLLINNADRKGSHIVKDSTDHLWLIDHGLCFHTEDKVRTVVWDFAGQAIPAPLLEDLARLQEDLKQPGGLRTALKPYLSHEEVVAFSARVDILRMAKVFPVPSENRRSYPWPPV